MNLTVNGRDAFVATGGREFDKSLPSAVLIHGAGFDHSAASCINSLRDFSSQSCFDARGTRNQIA